MKDHPDEIEDAFCDRLGACHCADPSQAMGEMRWALEQVSSKRPDSVPMLLLYYLDSRGLIEHGSSLATAWLTTEGAEFLAWLRGQNAEALPVETEGAS